MERALSHYRFSVEAGVEQRELSRAVRDDIAGREPKYDDNISVSPFAYARRGQYINSLKRLDRHVARDQIHVVVLEELVADPLVVGHVYRHLGVDDTHVPAVPAAATNPSDSTLVVSGRLRSMLKGYFAPLNAELELYLGRRIDGWQ